MNADKQTGRLCGPSAWLWILIAAPSISAQQTWIVDFDNRPGTNYRDIPAAVSFAAPGDFIRVRKPINNHYWGSYTAAYINKALHIIGDPGLERPRVAGQWRVALLPVGSLFHMANIEFVRGGACGVEYCQGAVHLENIRITEMQAATGSCVSFVECALGIVSHSEIHCHTGLQAYTSRVMVDDSLIHSHNYPPQGSYSTPDGNFYFFQTWLQGGFGGPAIEATINATVLVSGSTLVGASVTMPGNLNARTAISVSQSTVTIGKGCTVHAGSLYLGGPVVLNEGYRISALHVDPGTVVNSVWRTDLPIVHTPQTGLRYQLTPTLLQVDHLANPLSTSVLAIGSLTTPWTTSIGPVVIDPNGHSENWSLTSATGVASYTFPIPPGLPQGYHVALQCFELQASGAIKTSNAVIAGIW